MKGWCSQGLRARPWLLPARGGNGITMEYDLNRHLRDFLVTTIYEGPDDVRAGT